MGSLTKKMGTLEYMLSRCEGAPCGIINQKLL